MNKVILILIFSLVAFPCFATTVIMKDGDREVTRWTEFDGKDQVKIIDPKSNVLSVEEVAPPSDDKIKSNNKHRFKAVKRRASSQEAEKNESDVKDVKKPVAPQAAEESSVLIGKWLVDFAGLTYTVMIRKESGKYIVKRHFKSGGVLEHEPFVKLVGGEERLYEHLNDSIGDYFIIARDGTLKGYDNEGYIFTAQPLNEDLTDEDDAMKSSQVSLDPRSLDVGVFYKVSEETPLMPEVNPKDPIEAMGKIKTIMPGGAFKVIGSTQKGGVPWYEVSVRTETETLSGWINSGVLQGQDLEV